MDYILYYVFSKHNGDATSKLPIFNKNFHSASGFLVLHILVFWLLMHPLKWNHVLSVKKLFRTKKKPFLWEEVGGMEYCQL